MHSVINTVVVMLAMTMTQQVNLGVRLAGLQHADGDIAAASDRCTELGVDHPQLVLATTTWQQKLERHCLVEIRTCTRATTTTQCQTHGCHYRYTLSNAPMHRQT